MMTQEILLFGSSTPTGEAFKSNCALQGLSWSIHGYSRKSDYLYVDFDNPKDFTPIQTEEKSIWISFSPINLFANFISYLSSQKPEILKNITSLIVCSTTSVITKRFSTNDFDRINYKTFLDAEAIIKGICLKAGISLTVLRPTMIYGNVGEGKDKNISLLLKIMRNMPILALPRKTGLRQPIHADQLAKVAVKICNDIVNEEDISFKSREINLGGDEEINYYELLKRIKGDLPNGDRAKRCYLLLLPSRLFYFFASPLIIFSPKLFEAILRIGANLSGFKPSSSIIDCDKLSFPVRQIFKK